MSLPNITFACNVCHFNAGGGTPAHFDYIVQVTFSGTTYNAKSGTAGFNTLVKTCSNVSCHGASRTQTSTQAGQTPPASTPAQTPDWLTGTIDANTDAGCKACHVLGPSVGLPENNSYYSGEHRRHVYSQRKACTDCHDTVNLAVNHFTSLNTTAMEGPASATLRSDVHYVGANGSGSCSPACHGGESW
jgi:predicted CxxxxCH...CXXCH cytochrome family protein